MASWESGYPSDCKSAYTSSILVEASRFPVPVRCFPICRVQRKPAWEFTRCPVRKVCLFGNTFKKNMPLGTLANQTGPKQPYIRPVVIDIWLA